MTVSNKKVQRKSKDHVYLIELIVIYYGHVKQKNTLMHAYFWTLRFIK